MTVPAWATPAQTRRSAEKPPWAVEVEGQQARARAHLDGRGRGLHGRGHAGVVAPQQLPGLRDGALAAEPELDVVRHLPGRGLVGLVGLV